MSMIAAMCGHDCPALYPGSASLPGFFFEDAGLGTGSGWSGGTSLATDALWLEPNTFQLLRCDVRATMNANGTSTLDFSNKTPGAHNGAYLANNIVNRLLWFRATAPHPSGKSERWRLLLAGFDAADQSCSVHVGRQVGDRYAADKASPFAANARAELAAWVAGTWEALRAALDAAGLPHPEALLTDIEPVGDVEGGALWPTGDGGEWAWALADPRANTELIDGVSTLTQWAAARAVRFDGSAYPVYPNGSDSSFHPVNFDMSNRCVMAVQTACMRTLEQGVFAPFRAVFGSAVPCGEWALTANSAARRVLFRPGQYSYDLRGYLPQRCIQVPKAYSGPPKLRADGSVDADPRWETLANWLAAYPAANGGATTNDKIWRVGRYSMRDIVEQCRAVAATDTMVSVSTDWVPTAEKAAAALVLGAFCADAFQRGAANAWIWEPSYGTDANTRASVLSYVRECTRRLQAGDYS